MITRAVESPDPTGRESRKRHLTDTAMELGPAAITEPGPRRIIDRGIMHSRRSGNGDVDGFGCGPQTADAGLSVWQYGARGGLDVGGDIHEQDRLAHRDEIAVLEVDLVDLLTVDQGPIGAPDIDQAALGRVHLDHAVDAGNVLPLIGKRQIGSWRPSDDEVVVPLELESLAFVWSRLNLEADPHGL